MGEAVLVKRLAHVGSQAAGKKLRDLSLRAATGGLDVVVESPKRRTPRQRQKARVKRTDPGSCLDMELRRAATIDTETTKHTAPQTTIGTEKTDKKSLRKREEVEKA